MNTPTEIQGCTPQILSFESGLLVVFAILFLAGLLGWGIELWPKLRQRLKSRAIRARARALLRDPGIAAAAIAKFRQNTTGPGIAPGPEEYPGISVVDQVRGTRARDDLQ